jgi:hypothetical protein
MQGEMRLSCTTVLHVRSINMAILGASGLEHVLQVRTLGKGDKMPCHAGSKPSSLMIVLWRSGRHFVRFLT